MTATLTGRAGQILVMLESLALPNGKNALFNPLPLKLSPGKISVVSMSAANTSYVIGDIEFPTVTEDALVTVDALELIKFLNGFESGQEVTITFADPITIASATRSCKVHPEAITNKPPVVAPPFVEGIAQFKSGPATTRVVVDAASLQGIVKDAGVVEAPAFPIAIASDGVRVSLGGLEAKKNAISRFIPATVSGPAASTVIGEDFGYVLGHAIGPVELQMSDKPNHPLIIVANGIRFLLLPRAV